MRREWICLGGVGIRCMMHSPRMEWRVGAPQAGGYLLWRAFQKQWVETLPKRPCRSPVLRRLRNSKPSKGGKNVASVPEPDTGRLFHCSKPSATCQDGIFRKKARSAHRAGAGFESDSRSGVVIQVEFVGVGAQGDALDLTDPLVVDVGLDQALREHVAFE